VAIRAPSGAHGGRAGKLPFRSALWVSTTYFAEGYPYSIVNNLAEVLCDKPDFVDCGDLALLRGYERARKEEVVTLQTVTDSLHDLFRPTEGPLPSLRNFGLNLTNALPVVKDLLVRYALAS
jgi:hypothetical protein